MDKRRRNRRMSLSYLIFVYHSYFIKTLIKTCLLNTLKRFDMEEGGLNHYKSLVSDNEVIEALIKESKAREGDLEKTRVRPNLNFFQRTVSNIVSSNKRIATKQEEIIAKEKEKNTKYRPRKVPVRKKLPIQLIQEILSNKINFVRSSDKTEQLIEKATELKEKPPENRKKKTPFQLMREILTNQVQFVKAEETKSSSVKTDPCSSSDSSDESYSGPKMDNKRAEGGTKYTKRKRRKDFPNTSDSVISLSETSSDSSVIAVNTEIIRISDSDSSTSDTPGNSKRKKKN